MAYQTKNNQDLDRDRQLRIGVDGLSRNQTTSPVYHTNSKPNIYIVFTWDKVPGADRAATGTLFCTFLRSGACVNCHKEPYQHHMSVRLYESKSEIVVLMFSFCDHCLGNATNRMGELI